MLADVFAAIEALCEKIGLDVNTDGEEFYHLVLALMTDHPGVCSAALLSVVERLCVLSWSITHSESFLEDCRASSANS